MATTRSSRVRRKPVWQMTTGFAACALAGAAGCASNAPIGVPAQAGVAPAPNGLMVGPTRAGAYATVERNGQLFCTGCNAKLNADGSHPLADMLIKNLQFLKSGDALKVPRATAGERTLREFLPYALLKLGMAKHLHLSDPSIALGALKALEAKPFDYHGEITRRILDACCVPDGVPAPDPPY